jgi:hypothetical protein
LSAVPQIVIDGFIVSKGYITEIDIEAEGFWIKESPQRSEDSFQWNEKYDGQLFFYLSDIENLIFPCNHK